MASEQIGRELRSLLDETFERVDGIYLDRGTSLCETLETVSAEEASRPVSAGCASIAGQTEHVRCYLDVLDRALRGEEIGPIDWDATWRVTKVTPEEWEALKGGLVGAYRGARATILGVGAWDAEHDLGDALAVVVHTAYHLGEIRQALCTVRR